MLWCGPEATHFGKLGVAGGDTPWRAGGGQILVDVTTLLRAARGGRGGLAWSAAEGNIPNE